MKTKSLDDYFATTAALAAPATEHRHEQSPQQQKQQQHPPCSDCSLFTMLPSDGMDAILSFLNYRDCLSLGETSRSALVAIQGDLKTRQKRMTQTFAYQHHHYHGQVQLWDNGNDNNNSNNNSNISPFGSRYHDDGWTILPTVRDRVEILCRALPTSHPLSHVVLDLLIDIDENVALQDEDPIHSSSTHLSPTTSSNTTTTIVNMENALMWHRKHCRSHKLHALILSQVIRSNPNSIEHVYHGVGARSCVSTTTTARFLTVTLDRYIGDVLCAATLMGHGVSGIVQGGPCEQGWEHDLECELGMDHVNMDLVTPPNPVMDDDDVLSIPTVSLRPMNVPVDSWYRAWIYIHSTLLRTAPLSHAHQLHLGMTMPSDVDDNPAASSPSIQPHRPYMGGDKSVLMHKMSLLSNWEPLRVTFNEFGRLGPTFRGRDLIQSHTIFPAGFISSVKHFSQQAVAASSNDGSSNDNAASSSIHALHLRRWTSGEDAVIQWLLEVHGSVGKARPMTVMPPMACFRSGGL